MNETEILKQVNEIFSDTLDNIYVINRETTVFDIDEWDSLTNIQLVVATEKHFKIRFTSIEIQSWNNVGEMIDDIGKKLLSK